MTKAERLRRVEAQSQRMLKVVKRLAYRRPDKILYALDYWHWLMRREQGPEPAVPKSLSLREAQIIRTDLRLAVDPEL